MVNVKKLDNELYGATYGLPIVGDKREIWESIRNNVEALREAVKVKRNKLDDGDIVEGLAISDAMLIDYRNVDTVAYNELVNSIYTNTDIARIVIDGASNGGFSFLLMSLWNHDFKLSEEQKAFAVSEAMNKIGTTKYKREKEEYSRKLEEQGITDNMITTLDIDGCVNPIGAKAKNEYFNYVFCALSETQAHGTGAFDIRYHILRNPNWSTEEKQQLVMDFWYDDEAYDEYLEQWEWGIVNDQVNYKGNQLSLFDKAEMYEYSYDALLTFYGNKETTDRIWQEIQFCKQMHNLRPQQWEMEFGARKNVLTKVNASQKIIN